MRPMIQVLSDLVAGSKDSGLVAEGQQILDNLSKGPITTWSVEDLATQDATIIASTLNDLETQLRQLAGENNRLKAESERNKNLAEEALGTLRQNIADAKTPVALVE